MLAGLPARVLRALLIKRPRRPRLRSAVARAIPAVAFIAGLFLAGPLTYDPAAHGAFTAAARTWSRWGSPFVGLEFTMPRQNLFTLAYEVGRPVTVVDHGAVRRSYLIGPVSFLSRGGIATVADALRWFGIPVTAGQARTVEPCRQLADLRPGEDIIIQPDPYQYGVASWYGPGFHGRLAASGEIYNMYDRTAAHKTLPLQSLVRVVSQRSGQSTVVRINDRGPYVGGRIIDLSHRAKELLGAGDLAAVYIERLDPSLLDAPCE